MAILTRKTKRLLVRPLSVSDYSTWKDTNLLLPAEKNKWDRKPKLPIEVTRSKFQKILSSQRKLRNADKFYDLAVFERASGQLIGTVAIMDVLRGLGQSAYLGYFINNPFWGKGFGKEAALAAIDIGFKDLKLHRLEAGIEPTNRRSIMMARSIGLRKEGLKKRAVYLRGEWVDLAMYSATCEDFGFSSDLLVENCK